MRMRGFKLKVLLPVALALAAAALPAAADEPVKVTVGVYINQIYDVSLKDNKFSVDFWIWFRWQKPGVDPLKTFEIVGGIKDSQVDNETVFEKSTGEYYASSRVNATINKFWDVSRFPLDDHVLDIVVEDNTNDSSKLVYVPDEKNCGLEPGVQVPGWQVGGQQATVTDHTYKTSYGDPSLPPGNESVYSRFFTVFIATLIALMALLIKPTDLDPRFGLGAGALFAAVASEMVIASSLPDTNVISLPDKLHIVAIFFIFASIFESIVSLRVFSKGQEDLSKRIDKVCLGTFLVVYLAVSAFFVIIK
jgi:hypothetical protein